MNKIGFQTNLFIIVLILLINITILFSCEKDNHTGLSKENLYGKWIGPTTKKTFDFETQTGKPINNILDFLKSGYYEVSTPELGFKAGFDSHPNLDANWDVNIMDGYIRLFNIPFEGSPQQLPIWEYRWKVINFTPDSMKVNVYDQNGIFIRERTFRKME
jgi:hypothetical protein